MSELKKKHLIKFLRRRSGENINFITNLMVETMEKICMQCQRDRIRCTLDPMCDERKYLTLLIEAGVPEKEYPQFCYAKKGEEIAKFFMRKTLIVPVRDAVYPIIRLIEFIFPKKKIFDVQNMVLQGDLDGFGKEFVSAIRRFWEEISTSIHNKKLFLLLNRYESLTIFDANRNLAYINLERKIIEDIDDVKKVLELLCLSNNFDCTFVKSLKNHYVKIVLKNFEGSKDVLKEKIRSALKNLTSYVKVSSNSHINIILTMFERPEEKKFEHMRRIFKTILNTLT